MQSFFLCGGAFICLAARAAFIVDDQDKFSKIWKKIEKISQATPTSLKILSWNIEEGRLAGTASALDVNIRELIASSQRPDLLIFQEYTENALPPATLAALEQAYPQRLAVPYVKVRKSAAEIKAVYEAEMREQYQGKELEKKLKYFPTFLTRLQNRGSHYFMGIFSRIPGLQLARVDQLDWVPASLGAAQATAYKERFVKTLKYSDPWIRPYLRLDFNFNGRPVTVIPMHLLMPWFSFPDVIRGLSFIDRFKNKAKIYSRIVGDREGPHAEQVRALIQKMQEDELLTDGKNTILIGDFNTFLRDFWWRFPLLKSEAWSMLTAVGFQNAFKEDRAQFTFPTTSIVKRPKALRLHIDHAVYRGQVIAADPNDGAQILPLAGSDHYPIYVIFK